MLEFNHIGIFVKDLDLGLNLFRSIVPIKNIELPITDKNMGVKVQFINDSMGIRYELVAPYGGLSPVSSVVSAKKNIINHLAYLSDDFEKDIEMVRNAKCIPLGVAKPARAFNGSRVIFFYTSMGFIYEVIESVK